MTAVPVITVFERSPDGGRGLARDMRVRWALEEVGQPYEVHPVSFAAMKEPAHRALHPFGQIPTYEENGLKLFETGAIVLHIASCHEGLLPPEPGSRARAINWIVAALSTVEPVVMEREAAHYLERGRPWYAERQRLIDERVLGKLTDLSRRVGDADWLDGGFSAGDLMIADVLRRLVGSELLESFPNLAGYVARAEARPAFQRAYAAQRAFFHAATG